MAGGHQRKAIRVPVPSVLVIYSRFPMAELCIVHLARGANGPEPLRRFLDSYGRHRAGIAHDLVVIFKGYGADEELARDCAAAKAAGAIPLVLDSDDGFDLGSYFQSAEQVPYTYLCFLNSFSRIIVDDWLGHLWRAIEQPGMGMVGATGSWESGAANPWFRFRHHPDMAVRGQPADLLRVPWHSRHFPWFPNPHLRSNAFLLRRDLMLSLKRGRLTRKADLHFLESGYRSLTRQVQAHGLSVAVTGADGRVYPPEAWSDARVFRTGAQENLLVSDNRTEQFARATAAERCWLEGIAWGCWG
jgi:hypothetical protein